jgi:ribonuclease HI
LFGESEVFDYYTEKSRSTKPFPIRNLEAFASLNVDLNMVEKTWREEHPPWISDNMNNIITRMTAVPKGAGTIRLKTELEQVIEEEEISDFTRVYTDGSKMDNLVGYAVIYGTKEIRIRLAEQTCIFSAEAQAIIEAIKATRRWRITKKVILTDSLSSLMAQESLYSKGNSKTTELKNLLAEEGSSLRLMWVPAHSGVTGNERADKAAREALDQSVEMRIKVVKSDYTKWVREKCKDDMLNGQIPQTIWFPSNHKFKNTQGLPRKQQVTVS